jgi:hypothetical protein
MRYHWGFGVGHLHAHQPASTSESCISDEQRDTELEEDQYADLELDEDSAHSPDADGAIDMYESDNPESGLDERDLEGWQDMETDSDSDVNGPSEHDSESESEEDFVGI